MVRSPKYPSAMTTSYATDQIELAVRLRLAVMRLTRMLRQQEDGGVSNSALSALATLEREGALTLGDLAGREHVQPPTMTRIAQALVENGQVPMAIADIRRSKALALVLEQAAVVDGDGNVVDLKALDAELKAASGKSTDRNTKAHISDLRHRIADAIKGKAGAGDEEG